MKKRMICILLLLCMLVLLPGCRQMRANRANMKLFRSGYARLQGLSSVYVRNEQYAEGDTNPEEMRLLVTREEWRNGEDFYREDTAGDRFLSFGGKYWDYDGHIQKQWREYSHPDSVSSWWKNRTAESFFAGQVTFREEGEFILLELTQDLGSDNCTFSRQIDNTTVYMRKDGEITRCTRELITYSGREVDPEKIHSISKSEYYITPLDPEKTAQIIQTQYQAMTD